MDRERYNFLLGEAGEVFPGYTRVLTVDHSEHIDTHGDKKDREQAKGLAQQLKQDYRLVYLVHNDGTETRLYEYAGGISGVNLDPEWVTLIATPRVRLSGLAERVAT